MLKNCVEIKSDALDIVRRLREIDKGYFVVRNRGLGRFEVHSRRQHDSFCLALPYSNLDARTIEHVRRTRSERADKIFAELEAANCRLERDAASYAKKNAMLEVERLLSDMGK